MALSLTEIQAAIKNPKASAQLLKAVKHQQRLRFHAEEAQDNTDVSPYYTDFLRWVAEFLPADKLKMFTTLLQFPVYTNEILKAISEEYQKVYEAENASFSYEFNSDETSSRFEQYLNDQKFWDKWKEASSDAMLKDINALVVIDMPENATDTEPYFYFQDIDQVKDIGYVNNVVQWILVNQKDNQYLLIDDVRYALLDKEGSTLKEAFHELGYCPVCFFWDEMIQKKRPIIKRSPITPALNNLNWLLFWETARRCLETYGAYPLLVKYEEICTYKVEVEGVNYSCDNGFLYFDAAKPTPCPGCAKQRLTGPGTVLETPMVLERGGANGGDSQFTLDAAKFIDVPEASLNYNKDRSTELWDEIYYDCCGYDGDMTKQAINEKQVKSRFESKLNVLLNIKVNLEKSHGFVVSTIARLKFGDSFKSCSINYGTDFYLQSSGELVDEYKNAKQAGSPQYFLNYKRQRIDNISTKGNDNDAERLNILKHLEPWIDLSLNDVKNLGLNFTNQPFYFLKADFSRMILRFETEYGSITEFGSLIDFKTKISKIQEILINYVKIDYKAAPDPAATDTAVSG